MKCDQCQVNDANVLIRRTVNGEVREQHLCSSCAAALQQTKNDWFGFGNLFGQTGGLPIFSRTGSGEQEVLKCSRCGLTYPELRRTGLLGCPHCYDTFSDYLETLFHRIQRGTRYQGRNPAGDYPAAFNTVTKDLTVERAANENTHDTAVTQKSVDKPKTKIEELKARQAEAVAREDYEEAARLRDAIHALEDEEGGKR